MNTMTCAHCGGEMQLEPGRQPKLCPYCGKPLSGSPSATEPSALDLRLKAEKDPRKKFKMIREALDKAPDDFEANRALLYHGRLHEPMKGRTVDFSIIKSHLLSVFDTPEAYSQSILDAKFSELLSDPQLTRTMALAPDADAFYDAYLHHLAFEYIDLFVRGDSRYNRAAFGFGRSPESTARKCAQPVMRMLDNIAQSDRLNDRTRLPLLTAVRESFAQVFPGFGHLVAGQ